MPFNLQMPELILILLVVVLLFGAKRLPETARALGKSLRIFKAETKAMKEDDTPTRSDAAQPAQPAEPRAIEARPGQPVQHMPGAAEPRKGEN
ncbi:twin-arginine translocase TatA/TatE family subunit [Carbonactinospora thermoautotrophica]|uniref:Sec-independent protein translocase subunit TatA n=1 Tax=Carbonactinospora thermoautotrophica TaxID=1469144 RepID=UPI0022715C97|nr:Sec-independent protein translocase subunit TatA [Carbonactinospora thermoautotrophica]MCX9192148.1 twin-arginine translocase TatA/TatE family subunit [Carbonactinospora thermoautotrophica]